jgi:hypothetical protein
MSASELSSPPVHAVVEMINFSSNQPFSCEMNSFGPNSTFFTTPTPTCLYKRKALSLPAKTIKLNVWQLLSSAIFLLMDRVAGITF